MKIDSVLASSLAGKILFANLLRVLNDSSSSIPKLSEAVLPFFAIQFSKEMLQGMDAYKFSVILTRLRRSILPADIYRELIIHVKTFLVDRSAVIPFVFEEWRRVIVLSGLDSEIDFPDWIPILNTFAVFGFHYPNELACATRIEVQSLIPNELTAPVIWKLWRFVAMANDQNSSTTINADLSLCTNANTLALQLRSKEVRSTSFAKTHSAAKAELGLGEKFDLAGPAARIRMLERAKFSPETLNSFLNTGSQVNTLRQVQGSLRSVASGIQCWASFCDLLDAPYFPPTAALVVRWSTVFKPGRSFGGYVAHLSKACQLLNIPLTWYNAAVRGVIHGLENAQDISFKFDNYITKRIFRLILAHETLNSEFGRLCYLAYVFILRLPSEALPAVRASPSDELIKRSPLPGTFQALIGTRFLPDDSERLVLKLRSRKSTRGGAIIMRPCFCDADDLGGKGICPIHDFWPAVCSSSLWGEDLFPTLRSRNINRILKGMLRSMKIPDADSFSTHAFRRGASMELKNSGSTLAQILKTVGWNSSAFRAYLSFIQDEEVNIRSILSNCDSYESSDCGSEDDLVFSSTDDSSSGTDSDNQPLSTLRQKYRERFFHWVIAFLTLGLI